MYINIKENSCKDTSCQYDALNQIKIKSNNYFASHNAVQGLQSYIVKHKNKNEIDDIILNK